MAYVESKGCTCEVIEAVIFKQFVHHGEDIPHSLRDGLAGETVDEGQQLFIKLCEIFRMIAIAIPWNIKG